MWRIERVGWWVMAAILGAALAGLFGHGPLSRAALQVADPTHPDDAIMADYDRLGRAHSESQFVLSGPARPNGESFSLWVSEDYLTDADVLRITPEPSTQELVSNGVRYHFRLEEGPRTVIFRFEPDDCPAHSA